MFWTELKITSKPIKPFICILFGTYFWQPFRWNPDKSVLGVSLIQFPDAHETLLFNYYCATSCVGFSFNLRIVNVKNKEASVLIQYFIRALCAGKTPETSLQFCWKLDDFLNVHYKYLSRFFFYIAILPQQKAFFRKQQQINQCIFAHYTNKI